MYIIFQKLLNMQFFRIKFSRTYVCLFIANGLISWLCCFAGICWPVGHPVLGDQRQECDQRWAGVHDHGSWNQEADGTPHLGGWCVSAGRKDQPQHQCRQTAQQRVLLRVLKREIPSIQWLAFIFPTVGEINTGTLWLKFTGGRCVKSARTVSFNRLHRGTISLVPWLLSTLKKTNNKKTF